MCLYHLDIEEVEEEEEEEEEEEFRIWKRQFIGVHFMHLNLYL